MITFTLSDRDLEKIKSINKEVYDFLLLRIAINVGTTERIIDYATRYEVCKRQKWRCNNCNEQLKFSKHSDWDGKVAHIDHIHPFSERISYPKGAMYINEISNLQALCPKCNLTKHKKKN